ncbi:MAG: hypothetical protein B7Y12_11150 [Rhizobiales bacterium 24-66-13]|jgi:hypothetical protein|nr:MAG: hypothetical protein B7Y12_11150 [Rhizobiales bacterium 24-66-13]OZA95973.1 MAG: hypothetical protein B7X67_24795 [Rhizobiales bacterium 39-66-18]HQS09652.1 hypothetical protein [Xanthobacteraceae bacterium]HQS48050.1 hypothetical protein [Xanthobacteraceae bacterium]
MAGVGRKRHGGAGFSAAAGLVRTGIAAAMVAGLAFPAQALLAPHYYEQARREAASVIVIAVRAVTSPSEGFGTCRVTGQVKAVERGAAHAVGQDITLAVPCRKAGAQPPLGGTIYQDVDALRATPFGRAYLDAQGALALSQYEMLKTWP